MTALHPALVFLGGLAVVVLGAELLLKSATRIAHMLRISPIVIGLTVVAIGTSLPELAVGITAAAEGKGALAVGNVAGANIMELLLVLATAVLVLPGLSSMRKVCCSSASRRVCGSRWPSPCASTERPSPAWLSKAWLLPWVWTVMAPSLT